MRQIVIVSVAATLLLAVAGCSSHQSVVTRTYTLPLGDTSWEAIQLVLGEEWQHHSVMSHAERRGDSAAIQTTARGHRKIEAALAKR
jgi:uncharacterized protein YcfL